MLSLFRELAPLLTIVGALLIARRLPPVTLPARVRWWAEGWGLPATAGVAAAVVVWYVWGGLHTAPFIHDESSYLLEAETLARGRFTLPSPPLPEFFEQFHVFVTPALASRYPAGWPLALVPGVWLGIPALIPLLLTGATAFLLTHLVRKLAGPLTAGLACLLWIAPPIELRFRPAYLSQHLSTLLWLVGFWALGRWREDRRARWLALLSLAVAWDGITRPLTAVAFAVPVAAVVLADAVRLRQWPRTLIAGSAGLVLIGVLLCQNRAVTGRWTSLPMKAYSEIYAPYDLPGFGLSTARPTRPLAASQRDYDNGFRPLHAQHVVERLPEILAARLGQFIGQSAGPWGGYGLLILALIGLLSGPSMALAGLTACALFITYLWFAHPSHWVAYYMEAHVVYAAAAAIGAHRSMRWIAARLKAPPGAPPESAASLALAMVVLAAAAGVPGSLALARRARAIIGAPNQRVLQVERLLPGPAILFIRNAPDHHLDRGYVENHADRETRPVWRVHDLGAHNADLIRLAPGRTPFLLDESDWTVHRLAPDGVTSLQQARAFD